MLRIGSPRLHRKTLLLFHTYRRCSRRQLLPIWSSSDRQSYQTLPKLKGFHGASPDNRRRITKMARGPLRPKRPLPPAMAQRLSVRRRR